MTGLSLILFFLALCALAIWTQERDRMTYWGGRPWAYLGLLLVAVAMFAEGIAS